MIGPRNAANFISAVCSLRAIEANRGPSTNTSIARLAAAKTKRLANEIVTIPMRN